MRNLNHDDQGRLTRLMNPASDGGNLATYAYRYDLNYTTGQYTMLGQRVSLTATVPSQGFSSSLFKYEYDSLQELNKVTYPNVAPSNSLGCRHRSWPRDGDSDCREGLPAKKVGDIPRPSAVLGGR